MAFCSTCGAQNPDGMPFCKSCGAPAATPRMPGQATSVVRPAAPVYAGVNASGGLVDLNRGATIAAVGGLISVVGFFLPYMKLTGSSNPFAALAGSSSAYSAYGSSYGSGGVDMSMSALASFAGILWLTPILMVLAALVRFAPQLHPRRRILYAGLQMAAGFAAVTSVLAYISMSSYFTILAPVMSLQIGAYAVTLGQLAVFTGGLVSMLDLTRAVPISG